jgi:hypothetical protein
MLWKENIEGGWKDYVGSKESLSFSFVVWLVC